MHERSIDSDFLLIILRDLVRAKRPDLRLVLMSATLNADTFAEFFQQPSYAPPPNVHIPGFTYPVDTFHLEDALEFTGIEPGDMAGNIQSRPKRGRRDDRRGGGADSIDDAGSAALVAAELLKAGYSQKTAQCVNAFDEDEVPYGQ